VFVGSEQVGIVQVGLAGNPVIFDAVVASVFSVLVPLRVVEVAVICHPFVANRLLELEV
jgi:hypothetical protein